MLLMDSLPKGLAGRVSLDPEGGLPVSSPLLTLLPWPKALCLPGNTQALWFFDFADEMCSEWGAGWGESREERRWKT